MSKLTLAQVMNISHIECYGRDYDRYLIYFQDKTANRITLTDKELTEVQNEFDSIREVGILVNN
jgi:hypothetical protein